MLASVDQSGSRRTATRLGSLQASMIGAIFMKLGRAPAIRSIRFMVWSRSVCIHRGDEEVRQRRWKVKAQVNVKTRKSDLSSLNLNLDLSLLQMLLGWKINDNACQRLAAKLAC